MAKYRKILVALDGSPASLSALRQALRLADHQKSAIMGITVMPVFEGDLDLTAVDDVRGVMRGPGEAILEEAQKIVKADRGLIMRTVLERGEPFERIVDLSEAEGCDLIVLGRHSHGRLARRIVGRVATRVIGYSKVDVLVVPEGASIEWGRILLATDGSRYSERAARRAVDFAKAYGESLDIVSVTDVTDEFSALAPKAREEMTAKASDIVENLGRTASEEGVTVRTFVKEGDAARCIADLAAQERVDVIFMGSHGRTGLRRLLMGSVTEGLISLTARPVLVVNVSG